jgi:hypothetical protein
MVNGEKKLRYQQKGLATRKGTHMKNEISITYQSKDMANIEVFQK